MELCVFIQERTSGDWGWSGRKYLPLTGGLIVPLLNSLDMTKWYSPGQQNYKNSHCQTTNYRRMRFYPYLSIAMHFHLFDPVQCVARKTFKLYFQLTKIHQTHTEDKSFPIFCCCHPIMSLRAGFTVPGSGEVVGGKIICRIISSWYERDIMKTTKQSNKLNGKE